MFPSAMTVPFYQVRRTLVVRILRTDYSKLLSSHGRSSIISTGRITLSADIYQRPTLTTTTSLVVSHLRGDRRRNGRITASSFFSTDSSPPPPPPGGTTTSSPQILLEHLTQSDSPEAPVVSVLTLNRPKANAMGREMLTQLQEALTELESHYPAPSLSTSSLAHNDNENKTSPAAAASPPPPTPLTNSTSPSRCVILSSSSRLVFSAGADLKERADMSVEATELFVHELRSTFDRVARLPMPVLAAMEGVAVGGGLELALAADVRIASQTAILGLPETSLAIIPGAGGTQRLSRLVGLGRAKQLILTADRIDGVTAEKYGLVQAVVEPGQCMTKALEWAWRIASHGPVAIRAAKWAVDHGYHVPSMTEGLAVERQAYARTLSTQDRREGLLAYQQARRPVYKGS